jgi:hypothetical protein
MEEGNGGREDRAGWSGGTATDKLAAGPCRSTDQRGSPMPDDISRDDLEQDGGAPDYQIRSEAELRALIGALDPIAARKSLPRLDKYCRQFISLSPFLCIGTFDANGRADVSPRGDQPGFVQILDDRTIAVPDRPGNNRLDTMSNILANPSVATVNNRTPKVMIRVKVEEAFLHCAKALKRSKLWDPSVQIDRKAMPSLARMILEQTAHNQCDDDGFVEECDRDLEEDYRTNLY